MLQPSNALRLPLRGDVERVERERDPERGTLTLDRFDSNLSTVRLHDVAHDREPESGPAGVAARA